MAQKGLTGFYTTAEIAKLLKLRPRTIQLWVQDGRLKAYQFGRKYRIRQDDLQAFLEQYKAKVVVMSEPKGEK
jgi:excisionase family DNA binding protein